MTDTTENTNDPNPTEQTEASAKNVSNSQVEQIQDVYTSIADPKITLGATISEGQVYPDALVSLPMKMLNRHGLVAGATGTGKTVTLQVMAEQLSNNNVPVFLTDIKGDLTGIATAGEPNDKLTERTKSVGQNWQSQTFPTEFYSLGGDGIGVPIRATVSSFGPILLSRVMDLNETQESSLKLIFHYADEKKLELYDDLKDLRAVIQHLMSPEGKKDLENLGGVSSSTAGVILRQLVSLEADGLDKFFGEPEFNPMDLIQQANGQGIINILELPTLQNKPLLFSTFLMWLISELFEELPEVGDQDKPKLVFFFDEAHLLFNNASKAFLEAITTTVRLIRSKGIGIVFVTQTPKDIPADVLAQLANRVQHALRAYTPEDAKALKATVSTFPESSYDLSEVLTSAGTGEAVVTVMDEKGAPTPVAWTKMWSPQSQMGPSDPAVVENIVSSSAQMGTYGTAADNISAYEKLTDAAGNTVEVKEETPKSQPVQQKQEANELNPLFELANQAIGRFASQAARSIFGTSSRRRRR